MVVIFSGAAMVIGGSTGWILPETKTSLTSDVMRLDFPVLSSPQTTILTESAMAGADAHVVTSLLRSSVVELVCGSGAFVASAEWSDG